jgi:O-antigen/teichoic acid export membrane protein
MEDPNLDIENLTKQVAKGGGIALIGEGVGKGIKFVFQIVLTRVLGPASYGLYTLGLSAIGIVQGLSLLGLPQGVLRFGSLHLSEGDKVKLKGTITSSFVLGLGLSIMMSILMFFLSDVIANKIFKEPDLSNVLRWFSVALPFLSFSSLCARSFLVFRKVEYQVGIELIFLPLINLVIVGFLFLFGLRLNGALYAYITSAFCSAILGFFLLCRLFPDLISELKAQYEIKPLLLYSLSVMLVGLSALLITKADKIMIGIFMSPRNVGIYNAASVVAFQGSVFLYSFHGIFAPIIADLHNKKKFAKLESLLKSSTKWAFGLTLPVVLIFVLFSKQIMLIFGDEFVAGWTVLITFSFIQLINVVTGSVGYILIMTGREKMELANIAILGLINIVLNYFMIPKFGILGAALATSVAYVLINISRLIEVYLLYKIHPYKLSYFKIMLGGIISIIGTLIFKYLFQLEGWLQLFEILVIFIIYMFMILILKLDKEDHIVLDALKNKIKFFSLK